MQKRTLRCALGMGGSILSLKSKAPPSLRAAREKVLRDMRSEEVRRAQGGDWSPGVPAEASGRAP